MRWLRRLFGRGIFPRARTQEERELYAEAFLRAGGLLRLEDFERATGGERAALVQARKKIFAEHAVELGLAIRSAKGAAQVLAPYDEGLAKRTLDMIERVAETQIVEEG